MALYFEWRINKNALLLTVFLAILPTRSFNSFHLLTFKSFLEKLDLHAHKVTNTLLQTAFSAILPTGICNLILEF